MPPILPLPSVKYIIVHWSFFQQFNKTNKNYISFLSVIVSVERHVIMTSNTYFRMTELLRVGHQHIPVNQNPRAGGGVNIGQLKVSYTRKELVMGPSL